MKKFLSIILSLVMILSVCTVAFAGQETAGKTLKFNSDGKFKILMINDSQDVGKGVNKKMVTFLTKAIEKAKPDLVVFVGDQLSDVYPGGTKEDFKIAIDNVCSICEKNSIPFAVTMGNHDHDRESVMVEKEQYEVYTSYNYCMNYRGCEKAGDDDDYFTFNLPVYSSNGDGKVKLNVYMVDSNNTKNGGYEGVRKSQVEWYENTSNSLKAANDGVAVPSLLFQHVPVKEIYGLMKQCSWNTKDAIFSRRDMAWYVLDEKLAKGALGEAPCSENFDVITGQYQSWQKQGDIIGAFFAHDHVNNFVGTDENGITMGYNGGSTFRSYGSGDQRSVRLFEINENDVANYTTSLLTYKDVIGSFGFWITDLFSPILLIYVMKPVYALFGWVIDLFAKK